MNAVQKAAVIEVKPFEALDSKVEFCSALHSAYRSVEFG
jgi:hypothetical protein